jgi:hypothetical protein
MWGNRNDAEYYIDGGYNLSAILKLIYPLKKIMYLLSEHLLPHKAT